jgi:hypothetical protein
LHEASESKEERIVDQRNDLIEAVVLRSGTLAQGRGARRAAPSASTHAPAQGWAPVKYRHSSQQDSVGVPP